MNGGVIVSCDRVDVSATPLELSATPPAVSLEGVNVSATPLELAATPPTVSSEGVDVSATRSQLSTAFIRQIPGFLKKPGICGAR